MNQFQLINLKFRFLKFWQVRMKVESFPGKHPKLIQLSLTTKEFTAGISKSWPWQLMSKCSWLTFKHNWEWNCPHLIRSASTSFNSHMSCSLHPCLWTGSFLHVQKSFHLHSKLENFLPRVSCGLPTLISKGFNMNLPLFFFFLIFWAPESDVTFLFLRVWAISTAEYLNLKKKNFEKIGESLIFIFVFCCFLL